MSKVVTPDPKSGPRFGKDKKPLQNLAKPPQPSLSLEEKLIVLTFGVNTNFIRWKEAMYHYLANEYGQLASILRTGKLFINPMPPKVAPSITEVMTENEKDAVANAVYFEKLKYWSRKVELDAEKYVSMYAIIWNYISSESQLQIKDVADWATIEEARDTRRLYERIVATHQTGEVRIAPLALKFAKKRYESCRQMQTETLAEYKRRFDDALAVFKAAGGRDIP